MSDKKTNIAMMITMAAALGVASTGHTDIMDPTAIGRMVGAVVTLVLIGAGSKTCR